MTNLELARHHGGCGRRIRHAGTSQSRAHGHRARWSRRFCTPSPEEWVELHNRTAAAVDISGWKLDDAIAFTFPAATTIPAGGFLVVNSGQFSGSLANAGDSIKLRDTLGAQVDRDRTIDTEPAGGTPVGSPAGRRPSSRRRAASPHSTPPRLADGRRCADTRRGATLAMRRWTDQPSCVFR